MVKGYSHNTEKRHYGTSPNEYKAFFKRVQDKFNLETLNATELRDWLRNDSMTDVLMSSKSLYDSALITDSLGALDRLYYDSDNLPIYKDKVKKFIQDKINSMSVKAVIKRTEVRAKKETVKIFGKEFIRYRDARGRFASILLGI